jgi:hypothetical protein
VCENPNHDADEEFAVFTPKDKLMTETKMHRPCVIAVAALGFATIAFAADEPTGRSWADQPAAPTLPPSSGSLSSDLNRSGGVIIPPAGIDPEIKQTPPPTGAKMPVIPPPGEMSRPWPIRHLSAPAGAEQRCPPIRRSLTSIAGPDRVQ